MVDTVKDAVQFAQAGQPEPSAAKAQPEKQEGQQPTYVTKDELRAALEEQKRQLQSQSDKAQDRIRKEMERLTKMGVTPDQAKVRDVVLSEMEQESPPPPQTTAKPKAEEADPVVKLAQATLKKMGIESIDENEPEAKLVNTTTDDPVEFLASVKEAGKAKLLRLQKQQDPTARIPGLASTGKSASLEQEYKERMSKIHGNVEQWHKLRTEYRAKGLQI